MKGLKAYIKSFEALQRSVKIQTYVIFCFNNFWNLRGGEGKLEIKQSLMKEFQEKSEKKQGPNKK